MKKFYSLIVALVVLSSTAHAQFLQWGIEGGLNLNTMTLSNSIPDVSENNRTGFFIGPKVKFSVPVIGIGLDGALLFNKMDAEFSTSNGAEKKSTNYLSIPLNLRYQIGLGDLLSAYIATGPQWNVLLSGKSWSIDDATNAGAKLKSSNFSWNVGVGIMALTHLQLGVTYNIPISKSGEAYFPVGSDLKSVRLKNNTWQIRAAYFF